MTRFLVQGREEFHPSLMVEGLADDHRAHFALMRHSGHRSIEFIALPDRLDKHYPSEAIIRVVLNNHRAHASKEAMAYLATRAGPFEYVHTPQHGSWLNLVESAFSKMARSLLRHIRVASLDELRQRILNGIGEMNAHLVRFQRKNFDFQMT